MGHPLPDRELAAAYLDGARDSAPLFDHARRLRDEGRGRTVTFSPKVFIPLTTLCRDVCTYCTFAKPPGAGGEYLTPEDAMAVARAGDAAGCREALLTLGDRPEERWPQARSFLASQGCTTRHSKPRTPTTVLNRYPVRCQLYQRGHINVSPISNVPFTTVEFSPPNSTSTSK